jgi:hypothetical protein
VPSVPGELAPERSHSRSAHHAHLLGRSGVAAAFAALLMSVTAIAPAAAQARAPAATPAPAAAPAPAPPSAPAVSHDPADAAFSHGTSLLTERCQQLRDAYDLGDRRPEMIRELADCYLIEADLWRAEALRADADRLAASVAAGAEVAGSALDLAQVRQQLQEACREFERSLELEPSAGAQIAVALCRLRQDKLASSRQLLEGMLPQMIARAGSGDPFDANRLSLVQALLKEIGRSQPRLVLRTSRAPAPELSIDGRAVSANQPHPLDAGTYRVTARRPSASAETTVTLEPRGAYTLSLDETQPPSTASWRLAKLTLGGAAAASALVGVGAWAYAHSRLGDFESAGGVEGDQLLCAAGPQRSECVAAADDVNRWRSVRTAGLVVAGTLAVATVVVHFVTPKPQPARLQWMPAVDREQLSLVVRGGF